MWPQNVDDRLYVLGVLLNYFKKWAKRVLEGCAYLREFVGCYLYAGPRRLRILGSRVEIAFGWLDKEVWEELSQKFILTKHFWWKLEILWSIRCQSRVQLKLIIKKISEISWKSCLVIEDLQCLMGYIKIWIVNSIVFWKWLDNNDEHLCTQEL